jgi:predicted transglutaminase-like cysteine proteinase
VSIKFVISALAAAVACAALGGCATDIPAATALTDGALTAAPAGWVNYCDRHLEDPGCR